ncbi:MAG: ATP-binding protein [Cyclobacteriaceae bacterium]|nr:ATP-binding protein [Cyclobacteriaceae bacterium]
MKNYTLLYTTLLVIILTLLVRWWVEEQFALVERNEVYVAKAINRQVSEQEFAMIPILDSLSLFGRVTIEKSDETPYPFFVFENGSLVNWSSFKFVPDYADVSAKGRYNYIDKPYGKFVVRKWIVNYQSKTFEVISLITLYRKYPINNLYIQSGLNPKIGQKGRIEIGSLESSLKGHVIKFNSHPICKIRLERGYKPAIIMPIIYIDFLLLLLQLLFYYALYRFVLQRKKELEVLIIILGWAYFKVVFPLMEGTTVFAGVNLFDPQYYAVSWFERSIADLLINSLFILLISIRLGVWTRSKRFLTLFSSPSNKFISGGFLLGLVFLTFWVINYPFFQLRSIYDNSQVSIDISQSLQFGWTRIITFAIVILVNLSTFLLYHTIIRHLRKYVLSAPKLAAFLVLALLLYLPLSYSANMPFAHLAIVNILALITIWYFDFTRSLSTATYKRFLYIVLFFGLLSSINSAVISEFESKKKVIELNSVLEKKLARSDEFAEFLLSTALSDLSSDQFIRNRFASPFLSKESIISKIKQVFLNSYLNKYDQKVILYDTKGYPLKENKNLTSIFQQLEGLDNENNRTEYPSVFRINDEIHNFSKHYLGYAPITRSHIVIGYVLVELIEKQISGSMVYPSILVDNRFGLPFTNKTSFAYYLNGEMVNSVGAVEFPVNMSARPRQVWFQSGLIYVSKSKKNRLIIASIPFSKWKIILSNFSFIWLITLFPILVVWFGIPFIRKNELKPFSYTERIIWYLNLAFIIPLILVTAVTFRLLSNSFEVESNLTKTILVERLSNQLSSSLANFIEDKNTYNELAERLELLSDNTELDINLFDLNGGLLSSSQPGVFNKKVLAPYINQYALNVIKEKGKNHLVLQESIDKLSYRNSYVAAKSEENGQILGIISVPFFSTNTTLNSSKREAFNTILNVFVIVLFATMLATYFAGKWLTRPLKLIGDKLKTTSFSEQTEPIHIQWSDELGMLIKAYNQMLSKLELSKESLKQSEKEKAWREAAQQVAHEIKNPLTPMKLTLQRLANKLGKIETIPAEVAEPLQSVLDQVETLNSIASSFSEFAKMPSPVVKKVEVHAIIKNAVGLFTAEKELCIKLQLPNQAVYSMLDSKLLSRMLNNLLLNAKQSIKLNQESVDVLIKTTIEKNLVINISDNGAGIRPEIVDKVFIPKFTTKEHGLGIGLAMTKYGVENMGGNIYFTSEPNVGTVFTIEFPIIN